MANLTSELFVGYVRLHDVIDKQQSMRIGEPDRSAVRAVQKALMAVGLGALMPRTFQSGTPDGVYGNETVAAASAFQTSRGLTSDGVVGPATLAALDGSFSPFTAFINIQDALTIPPTSLGFVMLDPSLASPPGKVGTYVWPSMPGAPGSRGGWSWSSNLAPGQGNKSGSASQFSVIFDHFLLGSPMGSAFVVVNMRLDAAPILWNSPQPQPVPNNPWFPRGASGTGQDFRGQNILWQS